MSSNALPLDQDVLLESEDAAEVEALEDEVAGLKQRLDALLAHLGD